MVWALLPLLFLALIFGFTAIERDLASITPPAAPFQTSSAASAAQSFILWHNVAMGYAQQQILRSQSYATQHMIYTGPFSGDAKDLGNLPVIPALWLVGYGLTSSQAASLDNMNAEARVLDPSYDATKLLNQDYVCIWMSAPAGTAEQIISQSGHDFTFGVVTPDGQSWVQASGAVKVISPTMQTVTLPIPAQPANALLPLAQPQPLSSIPCITTDARPSAGDILSYAIIAGKGY